MHPKWIGDLEITDEDMALVAAAYRWFCSNFVLCLKSMGDAIWQTFDDRESADNLKRLNEFAPARRSPTASAVWVSVR